MQCDYATFDWYCVLEKGHSGDHQSRHIAEPTTKNTVATIAELEAILDRPNAFYAVSTNPDGSISSTPTELGQKIINLEAELTTLRAQIAERDEKERWIPVTERLPIDDDENSQEYLVTDSCNMVQHADFVNGEFWNMAGGQVDAKAWRPLPEPWGGK